MHAWQFNLISSSRNHKVPVSSSAPSVPVDDLPFSINRIPPMIIFIPTEKETRPLSITEQQRLWEEDPYLIVATTIFAEVDKGSVEEFVGCSVYDREKLDSIVSITVP